MGQIRAAKHLIVSTPTDEQPIHSATNRAAPLAREIENQEIHKMLTIDNIEPAQTEWMEPVEFATKKDRSLRFCADYCKLHAVII